MGNIGIKAKAIENDFQQHGRKETIGKWFTEPVAQWLRILDGKEPVMALREPETLMAGMRHDMALRDILLATAACGNCEEFNGKAAFRFLMAPHTPRNAEWMETMLNNSFHGGVMPDEKRCRRAIDMLEAMTDLAGKDDGVYLAQPCAVIAYILWWRNDGHALEWAFQSIALDEDCSLAAIVISAINRNVWPAHDRTQE